jgi:hypothetical protein
MNIKSESEYIKNFNIIPKTKLNTDNIKIFIIHYSPLIERKQFIDTQLEKQNISAEYILNYDREDLITKDLELFDSKLKLSMVSLNLKHIECYRRIINDEKYDFHLILEDDALLDINFYTKLKEYLKQLPEEWDMCFIGDACNLHIPEQLVNYNKNINIFYKTNFPTYWGGDGATRCTDSYLISKKCCKQILNFINRPNYKISQNSDFWLNGVIRENNFTVFWAEPTLVSNGTLTDLFKSTQSN